MSNNELNKYFRKELNFRELGLYKGYNQLKVKEGLFYRSSKLYDMNEKELLKIKELGIKYILDLRSDEEVREYPDPKIEGIEYIHVGALIDKDGKNLNYSPKDIFIKILKSKSKNKLQDVASDFYKMILCNNPAFEKLFELLLNHKVPLIFHCSAGKDRTGVVALFILLILGVDKETIMEDYMLTNEYRKNKILKKYKKYSLFCKISHNFKDMITVSEGVLYSGLEASFQYILDNYKDYNSFFEKEYHLTNEDIEKLRNMYLN